jgi:hypothetical protein
VAAEPPSPPDGHITISSGGKEAMNALIRRTMSQPVLTLLVLVVVLCTASTAVGYVITRPSARSTAFPHNTAMEQRLGIRFSRLAVVGDGGLLQLSFVILDTDKATEFEAGLARPPAIVSESRVGGTKRISVMKQGHNLIPGQTYYLVYQNTGGAVRGGERASIVSGRLRLAHVPVLG